MNKATEKLFLELLSELPGSRVKENKLTAFSLLKGNKYNNKLLVIGRSVIGWHVNWEKEQSQNKATQIIEELKDREKEFLDWPCNAEGNPRPNYNPNASAFWRATRSITLKSGVAPSREDWSNYIAWSNLYKISKEKASKYGDGRPSTALCKFQFKKVKEILLNEIKDCNPINILFFTGWTEWAEDFIGEYFEEVPKKLKYIDFVGNLKIENQTYNCIISPHPQRKGDQEERLEEIKNYLK